MTITNHLENLVVGAPHIFKCGILVKSIKSDNLAVISSLIISVGKQLISLNLVFSSMK